MDSEKLIEPFTLKFKFVKLEAIIVKLDYDRPYTQTNQKYKFIVTKINTINKIIPAQLFVGT